MTVTSERPWPTVSRFRRIVPPVLVVALIGATALAGTAVGRNDPTDTMTGPTSEEVRNYADHPDLPVAYHEAIELGTVEDYDWGDRCDVNRTYNDTPLKLPRLAIPSTYAPPCVPVWGGSQPWVSKGGQTFDDNGGATAPGVTADTIRVVLYLPTDQDVTKQFEQLGVIDTNPVMTGAVDELVEMSNHLYETYGRRVELIPFNASGDGRSPSAARADAVKVVELGAFASIGGPNQTSAYQHELARSGVLCIQCGYASTDAVLAADAPYAWGYLATPDQLLDGAFGVGANTLVNKPARLAGDPAIREQIRRFGVVHYEQDPPIFGPLKEATVKENRARGIEAAVIIQYLLDPNSLNGQAQAIIGRLKREKVTTVVFIGDPVMPRLLMQQATAQDYFPEWTFTGTVFTDTSVMARLYDQKQMAHTYGTSSAAARTIPELSESWKLYAWWYGKEPTAPRTMVYWGPVVQMLYLGIHMAGPNLSAETFAGGLFNYPPTGGTSVNGKSGVDLFAQGYLAGDTTPAISFGPRGAGKPVDYVAVDDFTVSWWDPDAVGPDESGTEGKGLWKYSGLGLRLPLDGGKFPEGVGENFLFEEKLSDAGGPLAELVKGTDIADLPIADDILEATPPLDELPDYPPWPESPAG
jgi:hypothetical protein